MKIAVTYENNEVFQHFGRCENFKVFEIENNEIKNAQVINSNGTGHGALAGFLSNLGVEILICGGIGAGARNALATVNIQVYPGTNGNVDDIISNFIQGNLDFDPNTECHHHDHDHDHNCGDHGCGTHTIRCGL